MAMSPTTEEYMKHCTLCLITLRLLGKLAENFLNSENDSVETGDEDDDSPSSPTPETEQETEPETEPESEPETERRRFLGGDDSKGVGLGMVEALLDDESSDSGYSLQNPETPRIVLGVQIKNDDSPPPLPPHLWPQISSETETESRARNWSRPRIVATTMPIEDMRMSEEYTRVTTYDGPIPRVTHMYYNCIVDNSLFEDELSPMEPSFLSVCAFCNKCIGDQDIFMLRGERAFCTAECRHAAIEGTDEEEFSRVAAVKKSQLLGVAAV